MHRQTWIQAAAVALLFLALIVAEPAVGGSSEREILAQPVRFSEHLIMDGYTDAYGIWAADLDGDGDLDLTSADACHLTRNSQSECARHNRWKDGRNVGSLAGKPVKLHVSLSDAHLYSFRFQ